MALQFPVTMTWTLSSILIVRNTGQGLFGFTHPHHHLFPGLDGNDIVRNGFDHWINIVQRFLDRKLGCYISERHRTVHSSQFKYDRELDVDMLVSPFWREPSSLYSFLQKISPGDRYT